jgi:hypothetical protein
MAFWTIIGTGVAGDLQGKAFGLSLDTVSKTWIASGPSVDLFFKTKSGEFALGAIPELGTQLVDLANKEVAFLTTLLGTSVVGVSGTGRASEKGENFKWKLDSM